MKRLFFGTLPLMAVFAFPLPTMARGGVDVDVHISLPRPNVHVAPQPVVYAAPPPIAFAAPPEVVVLPGTYVYVVPDVAEDIFFSEGWWWRSWEGRWYRSRDYNSGWNHHRDAPSFYREIPSGWRNDYRAHRWRGHDWNIQRISHRQVQRNWHGWEKDRYWEKQQTWGVQGLQLRTRSGPDVNISVSSPPPIEFRHPPELIILPETYVYVVPDVEADIFFYEGWWWRPWDGRWYRSRAYDSGWSHYRDTPSFYREIPSGWRNDYRAHRWRGHEWNIRRIPHQQVRQNWSGWSKNRHWEKQQRWGVQGLEVQSQSQRQHREVQQQQAQPQYKQDKPQQQYKKIKPQHPQKQQGNHGGGNRKNKD